jgi:hypothetical protein
MNQQDAWWHGDPAERYWLEFTDRADLGADLRAPELDESGRQNWRYSLFKLANVDDVVFHYHKPHDAVVAVSRISGPWQQRPIVWGARGTFARAKGVLPHERPGYVVPLKDYTPLATPLRLEQLREQKALMQELTSALRRRYPGRPIYFPFELAQRPVRPLQGYAFKLPREFVGAFQLDESALVSDPLATVKVIRTRGAGQGFVTNTEARRAVERHAMAIALRYYRKRGFRVQNVSRTCPYDVLAVRGDEVLTIEVKGTAGAGESVFLTRNEVDHARSESAKAVLFVVYGVDVTTVDGRFKASEGQIRIHSPWIVDEGILEALQFRYSLPCEKL